MTITQRDRDLGTAYALRPPATRTELTSVGRGTPMGELLRRYWHPVGLLSDATDIPRKVRVLGEDLILFRDKGGRAGLLHARCCHRGTTLYYGKVEDDGIRCCYHGWKFDAEGRCLEQPCEPEGGLFKDKVRQPWYPVQERYGLIFAYLGPAEKKPVLPRYACLETMDDGEFVEADDSSIGGGGPAKRSRCSGDRACSCCPAALCERSRRRAWRGPGPRPARRRRRALLRAGVFAGADAAKPDRPRSRHRRVVGILAGDTGSDRRSVEIDAEEAEDRRIAPLDAAGQRRVSCVIGFHIARGDKSCRMTAERRDRVLDAGKFLAQEFVLLGHAIGMHVNADHHRIAAGNQQ